MKNILLISHLQIIDALAHTSPVSAGIPPMTSWLGAVHALERKMRSNAKYASIKMSKVGITYHDVDYRADKQPDSWVYSLKAKGSGIKHNGARKSFIEEPLCHLDVSLVIQCDNLGLLDRDEFAQAVAEVLPMMRFASGDMTSYLGCKHYEIDGVFSERALLRKLMVGHCIIERRDLMKEYMDESGNDAGDAILEAMGVFWKSSTDDSTVIWSASRRQKGWIVPICTGFQGITETGAAENQRDPNVPHRFAEACVTLGEFVMPHNISKLDDIMWQYSYDKENDLYLCVGQSKT